MKLTKIILSALIGAAATVGVASCSSLVKMPKQNLTFELYSRAVPKHHFNDMTYGIKLMVSSNVTNSQIYDNSGVSKKTQKFLNIESVTITPELTNFVRTSMTTFMRSMGFKFNDNAETDFTLKVVVKKFSLVDSDNNTGSATVMLDYALENRDHQVVIRNTATGRVKQTSESKVADMLDRAYSEALDNIQWNDIASQMTVHRRAEQEKNRSVSGDGDTSLEHTIIRWYIISSPMGADVSWRVISSTPEVKNTNASYVGTTPYETTEAFDIRGLNYQNSGDVQIEITCEKPGYLPQRRRFNVRQAIDQKEISAKFNLVREE